ncbi:demethylmenaquinone methyltransferase / 2-methoxy-6-polyprenyl-1,4-benzoquinol methylase [Methanosarcinales archaeon]|nr:methyltransferase domain-containing protein [Candidatus Methanoperedens sp.]CAG0951098.1 demethylmenaquinone methyltransferase / 2-methoxy-6-polyprenyl-1,4-benzoquinol methylase [Methanosarcinales archaeon]
MENDYNEKWKIWGDMQRYGPSHRHTRRLIRKYIEDLNYKTVLDVGCGEGSLLQSLNLGDEYELYGMDISKRALEIAKTRVKAAFEVSDISKQSLGKKFDLVICSEVLEHIIDDMPAIENLHKMSKNIIITVPIGKMCAEDLQVGHVRRYSREEILNKLKNVGFKIIKEREWGYPFYSPLYRSIIKHTPEESRSGKFGILRRMMSTVIYYIFMLNVLNKGDRLVILASSKSN